MTLRGRWYARSRAFDLERSNTRRYVVGDKSPKARDKQKKQQPAEKNQKDAVAKAKVPEPNKAPVKNAK